MKHSLIVKNYSLTDLLDWFDRCRPQFSFGNYMYQVWLKRSDRPVTSPTSNQYIDIWCTYPMAKIELSEVQDGIELTITSQDPDVLLQQLPAIYDDIWQDLVTGLTDRLVQDPAAGPELIGQAEQDLENKLAEILERENVGLERKKVLLFILQQMNDGSHPNTREIHLEVKAKFGDYSYSAVEKNIRLLKTSARILLKYPDWYPVRK